MLKTSIHINPHHQSFLASQSSSRSNEQVQVEIFGTTLTLLHRFKLVILKILTSLYLCVSYGVSNCSIQSKTSSNYLPHNSSSMPLGLVIMNI
jgi:hypothetical protein